MAVFWVHRYIALPVIVEELGMGDEQFARVHPQVSDGVRETEQGMFATSSKVRSRTHDFYQMLPDKLHRTTSRVTIPPTQDSFPTSNSSMEAATLAHRI